MPKMPLWSETWTPKRGSSRIWCCAPKTWRRRSRSWPMIRAAGWRRQISTKSDWRSRLQIWSRCSSRRTLRSLSCRRIWNQPRCMSCKRKCSCTKKSAYDSGRSLSRQYWSLLTTANSSTCPSTRVLRTLSRTWTSNQACQGQTACSILGTTKVRL